MKLDFCYVFSFKGVKNKFVFCLKGSPLGELLACSFFLNVDFIWVIVYNFINTVGEVVL